MSHWKQMGLHSFLAARQTTSFGGINIDFQWSKIPDLTISETQGSNYHPSLNLALGTKPSCSKCFLLQEENAASVALTQHHNFF